MTYSTSLLQERDIWLSETVTKQAWISFLIVSVILAFRTHNHDGVLADGVYYYSSWWTKLSFSEMLFRWPSPLASKGSAIGKRCYRSSGSVAAHTTFFSNDSCFVSSHHVWKIRKIYCGFLRIFRKQSTHHRFSGSSTLPWAQIW